MPPDVEGGAPPPDTATERAAERASHRRSAISAEVIVSLNDLERNLPPVDRRDTPEARRQIWEINAIESAIDRTIRVHNDQDTFENSFPNSTGTVHTQREGIPVEALIRNLDEQISRERNDSLREQLQNRKQLLLDSSSSYDDLHTDDPPEVRRARIAQEAELISNDERSTGTEDGDWFLAEQTLRDRREMRFPSIAGGADDEEVEETPAPTPVTAPPVGDPTEPQNHEVVIANRDRDAWKNARELAQKLIAKEQRAGTIFNPLTWGRKLGLKRLEMYWEQKLTRQIHEASVQSGNAYVTVDLAASTIRIADLFRGEVSNLQIDTSVRQGANQEAGQAVVENIKLQNSEGINAMGEEVNPGTRRDLLEVQGPMRDAVIRDLLRPTIRGEQSVLIGREIRTQADLQEALRVFVSQNENDPQIVQLFGKETNLYGNNSELFASDLLEMANSLRAHGYATKEIDERVKILLANPEWAGNSEATFSGLDDIIRWTQEGRVRGLILNPTVVSVGMALGLAGLKSAARKLSTTGLAVGAGTLLASPLIAPLAGVTVGAMWAAAERNANIKKDRARHQREAGYGSQLPRPGEAPRREALDQYQYFSATANSLLEGFSDPAIQATNQQELALIMREHPLAGNGPDLLVGDDRRGIRELLRADLSNPDNRQAVVRRIAEIRARLDHSSTNNVDLVSFEGKTQVEQGRFGLVRAMVEARRNLRDAGMTADQIRDLENQMCNQWNARFTGDRETQDRQFAYYRLRQSLLAGAVGGALGLATAFVSQEALTHTARWSPNMDNMPVVGSIINAGRTVRENIMEGRPLDQWDHGGHNPEQIDYEQSRELVQKSGASLEVRPGVFLEHASDNSYHFRDAHGTELYSGQVKVESDGRLIVNGEKDKLPTFIQELMSQPGVSTTEAEIPWNGTELYANGGSRDLGQNISLRVMVDAAGHRAVDLIDSTTGAVVPSPPLRIEPDGRFIVEQGFDKLPDNLKVLFNQTGWSHAPADGRDMTDFNIDKTKNLVTNYKTMGRLGLNGDLDMAIDPNIRPHLGESDHLISFTDKNQALMDQHPAWINTDGSVVIAGEHNQYDPKMQNLLRGMEAHEATEHNLRRYLAGVAKNGVATVKDENIEQGSIVLNTHDTHTGFLNEDKNPDGSPARLVYDEFAKKYHRIDSVTGQVEVGKMSFAYKPNTGEEIWVNGFLQQDGKIHVDPAYAVNEAHRANTTISAEQWQKVFGEMKKEGWTVDENNGHYIVTPPTATTYTPPSFEAIDPAVKGTAITLAGPPEQSPAIPIVDAPRLPLESLVDFPRPYEVPPMYYGGEDLESLRRWVRENPNLLQPYRKTTNPDGTVSWTDKDGRPVERNVTRERDTLRNYIEGLRTQDPDHFAALERYINDPNLHEMTDQNRVSINIPAWMEGKNIYDVLSQYSKQVDRDGRSLDPNMFEINIIVNRKEGTPPDDTVAEIERFKRDSSGQYKINYIDVEFDPAHANVGHARRVITDLAVMRSLRRAGQTAQLYIESEDADLVNIDQRTVINAVTKLDENPHLDAVRGIQDRNPEVMMQNDLLFLTQRLWHFQEAFWRRQQFRPENNPDWNFTWHRVVTGGWNTAYTAESYALIGGYDSTQTAGEDMTIGQKITMIRGDGSMPNLDVVGTVGTRTDSSPRRFIAAAIKGVAPYGDFMDADLNQRIRTQSLDQLISSISGTARLDASNKGNFAGMLEGYLASARNTTPDEAQAIEMFKSLMFWAGFKEGDYRINPDGRLEVLNWDNLQNALTSYRARHSRPRTSGERIRNRNEAPSTSGTSLRPSTRLRNRASSIRSRIRRSVGRP